jgi:DNA polymerase III subunit beta
MNDVLSLPPVFDDGAAKFTLAADLCKRIFRQAAAAYTREEGRRYLAGVHLVLDGHRLRAASSDGHRLLLVWVVLPEGLIPGPLAKGGAIVPGEACKVLAPLAFPEIRISEAWIEARTEDEIHAFRLIDATFPNLDHIIPVPSSNTAEIASADLAAALKKLQGATGHRRPIVKIDWLEAELRLTLAYHPEVASEKIKAAISGSATTACQIKYLESLVKAVGTKRVVLDATAEPGQSPIRITVPGDDAILGAIMPCRVQEEAVAPAKKGRDE